MVHDIKKVQILYGAARQFYAVLEAPRICGIWLSVEKLPLPVATLWHAPGPSFAAMMRGRDYYRIGSILLQHPGPIESIASDDELIRDYIDAVWWTPGLEEAWAEAQGFKEAVETARGEISRLQGQISRLSQLHICEAGGPKPSDKIEVKRERR